MTMNATLVLMYSTAIIVALVMIMWAALHPGERSFIVGFGLLGVSFVGALLRELVVIPRNLWPLMLVLNLGIAILGIFLVERALRGRRRSSSRKAVDSGSEIPLPKSWGT